MIPQPQKWRKQVQVSMSAGDLKLLEQLAEQDRRKWGGRHTGPHRKGNRSATVCELIHAEVKRRKNAQEVQPGDANQVSVTSKPRGE